MASLLLFISILLGLLSPSFGDDFRCSQSTASLSLARAGLAATSVGDLAMFAGGVNETVTAVVDVYNSTSGTWTVLSLSNARKEIAATSVNNLAIFAGGSDNNLHQMADVDIYNWFNNSWTTANLSRSTSGLSATSVGNLAMFAGGPSVDIYDSMTNVWSVSNLSLSRDLLGATSVGDIALFAGGYVSSASFWNTASKVVDIYNVTSNTWRTESLSVPHFNINAITNGIYAFFAAGTNSTYNPSNVLDIYNVATKTWSAIRLYSVYSYAPASIPNLVVFAGGYGLNNRIFYEASTIFTRQPMNYWGSSRELYLREARGRLQATSVGNTMLFAGGSGERDRFSDMVDIINCTFILDSSSASSSVMMSSTSVASSSSTRAFSQSSSGPAFDSSFPGGNSATSSEPRDDTSASTQLLLSVAIALFFCSL